MTQTFSDSIKFSQAAEEWLEIVMNQNKYSTYVKYRTLYYTHIAEILGSYSISQIDDTQFQIDAAFQLSDSMKKSIYCVVNQILKYAWKKYSIQSTPLKRDKYKSRKKRIEIFSKNEQSRLITSLYNNNDRYKTAVILCLNTGLRIGELCALKWDDIDFNNFTISVNRTVQRIKTQESFPKTLLLETEPKSMSSIREIPISKAIFFLLTKQCNHGPYIFGGEKPLEPRTLQYQFKKILSEAGICNKNFHVLRHTFATNCIENETDIKSLSEILGHSDVKITLNRYVHPTMDSKRRHIERLGDFYEQICDIGLAKSESVSSQD